MRRVIMDTVSSTQYIQSVLSIKEATSDSVDHMIDTSATLSTRNPLEKVKSHQSTK